ncbi:MAG: RNA polymerase sporulation sigma factor SigH [Bacillota bacterium]
MEAQVSFKQLKDEEVVVLAQNGEQAAEAYLLQKFKPLVKAKSRPYFLVGADNEDVLQEGMIGLYKAVRDFKLDKHTSFFSFAELCIKRQMITAVKAATRQKHQVLNQSISLNKPIFQGESEEDYMDLLQESDFFNPEALLIGQERKFFLEAQLQKVLSPFEVRVLSLYLQGGSYHEIAKIMKKPEKSVDNALQRVKKKLEKCFLGNEESLI